MTTDTPVKERDKHDQSNIVDAADPQINENAVIGLSLANQYMRAARYGKNAAGTFTATASSAAKAFDERFPNTRHFAHEAVTNMPSLALDTVGFTYRASINTFNFTVQTAVPFVATNTAKYGILYPVKYGLVLPAVLFDETFPKTSNVIKKAPATAFNKTTSGLATAFDTAIAAPYLFVKDDVLTPVIDRTMVQPTKQFIKDNPKVFTVFKRDPEAQPGPFKKRLQTSTKALWDVLPFEAPSEKYPKTHAVAKKGYGGVKKAGGAVFGAIGAAGKFTFNEALLPAAKFTGKNVITPAVKFAVNDVVSPAVDFTIIKPAKMFDKAFPQVSSRLQDGFQEAKSRSGKIATNALAGTVAGGILTVKAAFGIFDIALDWAWKKPSAAFSKWKPETAEATKNVYNAYQGVFKKIPYPASALLIPALGGPALFTTYWGTMGTKALISAQIAGEPAAFAGLKMASYTFGPKLAKIALFKPVLSMSKTTKAGFFASDLYNYNLKVGYEKYVDPGIQKSKKMVQDVNDWVDETIPSVKQIKAMLKPDQEGIKARAKKWADDVKPSIQSAFASAAETLRVRPKPTLSNEQKLEASVTESSSLDGKSPQNEWQAIAAAPTGTRNAPANDTAPAEEEAPSTHNVVTPT